jgi:peptidoglycan/LPS O-acetylase OafA/YrhL
MASAAPSSGASARRAVEPAAGTPSADRSAPTPPTTEGRELPSLRGHIPVLDGVRGLAILMVLMVHFIGNATPMNKLEKAVFTVAAWGQYGVDLFFVLSGFLITGILYDSRHKSGFFRNFYMRRMLRISPLYYGVLVVILLIMPLVPQFRGPTLDVLLDHQAWAWLYGVNIYNALHEGWALPYIDHFWSLAVEEHFYLVWPFVVWALGSRPRPLMIASLVIAVGALVLRIVCSVLGVGPHALYVLTPFRLDGLALGGFFAVLGRQPGGLAAIKKAVPRIAAATLALLVVRVAWAHTIGTGLSVLRPIRESLVMMVLACFLMFAVTADPRGRLPRILTSRTMTFLGTYSYGLYVYHHFFSYYASTHGTEMALTNGIGSHAVAVAVLAFLGLAVSVVTAYASYEMFEKHFLTLKRRFESGSAPATR